MTTRHEQRWRVTADEYPTKRGGMYGPRHGIYSRPQLPDHDDGSTTIKPRTEIDEVVIDRWFHLEQMDDCCYWMDIGGLVVNVITDSQGNPTRVMWELDERDGVIYE